MNVWPLFYVWRVFFFCVCSHYVIFVIKQFKYWQLKCDGKKHILLNIYLNFCFVSSSFFIVCSMIANILGSPAPGQPATTMIMEGLETFVAPSHHAFLLTESAAAAHFNVLSFDTCLLKSAATSTTFANNNNNNNLFTINNNSSASPGINCNVNCMSSSNGSNNNDSNHPSHHTNHINRNSNTEHQSHSIADAQTGDLNTPVTTSSDIPSFFGPNTIEPPVITGKHHFLSDSFRFISLCRSARQTKTNCSDV